MSFKINMNGNIAKRIEHYFDRLWPITRSITGDGIRRSMDILAEVVPTERMRFKTGQKVFDWQVPKEWVIREAYFIAPDGTRHCDIQKNNLHLMGYSIPFNGKVDFSELKEHLYSLPDKPDAIPYVTSYYKPAWGFCLSHNEFKTLPDGEYEVHIDTELIDGQLEIGEAVLPGSSKKEILFSSYLCHPSLANNELSGPLVMAFLYELVNNIPDRRFTYRFLFSAESIGTICYLSKRARQLKKNLAAGYVMTCLGDAGSFTYKESRRGDSLADLAARVVLRDRGYFKNVPFFPRGSDEKQYCSAQLNLPVGSLMRTMYDEYPEYHTSLDNKDFISFEAMAESVKVYFNVVRVLENNYIWDNTVECCVPMLGKRGLFSSVSNASNALNMQEQEEFTDAILWFINLADGQNDLISMAIRSGLKIEKLLEVSRLCEQAGVVKRIDK
jgi:aminopeptidase-like protein